MTTVVKQGRCVWLMLCAVSAFSLTPSVQAASFDCAKAQTAVERMICADAQLSRLDETLSTAYELALKDEQSAREIRNAQLTWMKVRNECRDEACVKTVYENRLSVLTHLAPSRPALPEKVWHCENETTPAGRKICEDHRDAKPGRYQVRLAWASEEEKTVCQIMLKNNRAHSEPLSCGLDFTPEFRKYFGYPEWEQLDPWANLDLLWQADVQGAVINPRRKSLQSLTPDEWLAQYKRKLSEENREPILLRGSFDLDGDAKPDLVLVYGFKRTLSCNPWSRFVPRDGFKIFDVDRSVGRLKARSFTGNETPFLFYPEASGRMGRTYRFRFDGFGNRGVSILGSNGGQVCVYDISVK